MCSMFYLSQCHLPPVFYKMDSTEVFFFLIGRVKQSQLSRLYINDGSNNYDIAHLSAVLKHPCLHFHFVSLESEMTVFR